ncbi:MAG: dihydropteroate synthase [Alphaproteobacteria bacterium]
MRVERLAPTVIEQPKALYLRPIGAMTGASAEALVATGNALAVAGRFFAGLEVLVRRADHVAAAIVPCGALAPWRGALPAAARARIDELLERLSAPCFEGGGAPLVMGVVNVTPDSFSDGGDLVTADAAIAHGRRLAEAGADILDVGGESTRPGATPIDPAEEIARAIPVVRGLARRGHRVSIDTRNAATMRAALDAGATMLNDVSALGHDPESLAVAAAARVPIVLMHAKGDPRTMQANPTYDCAPLDVFDALDARIRACEAAGIARTRLIVDPGIGFGKSVGHNLEVLARLGVLHGLGCAILIGASRKSFIARLSKGEPPKARLPGSIAAALMAVEHGARIVRAHDVAETVQALKVVNSVTISG